jgi:hypothetical protein
VSDTDSSYRLDDTPGTSLVSAVHNSDLCVLNSLSPTRLPKATNQAPSSPDVSLVSAHLVPSMTWSVQTTLNSDHLPITMNFSTGACPSRIKRTYTNFLKADWAGFIRESESLFSQQPTSNVMRQGRADL